MADKPLGWGLIGCGAFGRFSLKALGALDPAVVRAVAAAHVTSRPSADRDRELGVPVLESPEALLQRADVDIVHIATPPQSHHRLVMKALAAGKHVLCEKPLALTARDGKEMLSAAEKAERVLAVSFVMRYSPVVEAAKRIIDSGVLGKVLSGRATNCASDSGLSGGHWFWDKSVSGGIFIEHGVHFFDLYRYWIGPGEVVSAHSEARAGTAQEDRVTCEVRHESGCLSSHYHGFDQINLMDRTEHRLVCEMGDIRVTGWIPLCVEVDAALDETGLSRLEQCCPDADVDVLETFGPDPLVMKSRGKTRHMTKRVALRYARGEGKPDAYAADIRRLVVDQASFIRDPEHARRVSEADGLESLILAETAAKLARGKSA